MPTTKKKSQTRTAEVATKTAVKPSDKLVTASKTTTESQPRIKRVIHHPRTVAVGFADFLRDQSVVGLAIGLVIGSQVKSLADQLINSFINPLIGLLLPGSGALNNKVFTVHLDRKVAVFAWGSFTAVLLSFITTAAVVYFVFKTLNLDKLTKKKDAK